MRKYWMFFYLFFLLTESCLASAKEIICIKTIQNNNFFANVYLGIQNSGIRDEDFIKSNFSPYINAEFGKWLTSYLALTVGYQGPYFNFIGDADKHNYFCLDTKIIFSLFDLFGFKKNRFYDIHLAAGTGIMRNIYFQKFNWCFTGALIQEFALSDSWSINLKAGGIAGWAIYQHDKDMLPNLSIGLQKKF